MTQSPVPMPPGRDPLPGRTTPTWEMELLISGATVFSLMQAPALLDQLYHTLTPRLEADYHAAATLPYMYLMTACLALITTFLVHLCVRGFWVALVGLASVYPDGVNWERLRSWGPAYLRAVRQRTPSLPEAIERYDNRASQVFGFGVGLTFLTLGITWVVMALTGLAVLIHVLSQRALTLETLMIATVSALFGPYLLVYIIDGFTRNRAGRHPRLERAMDKVYRGISFMPFVSGTNFPLMLFASHVGGRRGNYLMAFALMALLLVSLMRMETPKPLWSLDGYGLLPNDGKAGHTLDPRHYADQRKQLNSLLPAVHIPSEEIHGDWLRVYIPFRPTPDTSALKRLCPELDQAEHQTPEAVLACLPQRFVLSIDGEPATGTSFDFASQPEQRLRGVVARIDVRDLARGRHELSLRYGDAPDATPSKAEKDGAPTRPTIRIPFWR